MRNGFISPDIFRTTWKLQQQFLNEEKAYIAHPNRYKDNNGLNPKKVGRQVNLEAPKSD
jgi:hypothetical protein